MDQFYINNDKRYEGKVCKGLRRNCLRRTNCWDHKCLDDHHVAPIELSYLNNRSNMNDWIFPENKTTYQFRTCLFYNQDNKTPKDFKEPKIKLFCIYSNNCTCNLTWQKSFKLLKIHFVDSGQYCGADYKKNGGVLKVDLICLIHDRLKNYRFGFHQPVEISFGTTTAENFGNTVSPSITTSNVPMNEAKASTTLIIFLVLVSVGGILCFLIYRRTKLSKHRKKEVLTIQNSELLSIKSPELGPNNLPSWLVDRRHLIYDAHLITKEEYLGGGVFGKVYKGKISLGNAVYVKPQFEYLTSK